jgi:hypothetical protein
MNFPLTVADVSLWLAVIAIILIITSKLLYSLPNLASKIVLDKNLLRFLVIGCGLDLLFIVLLRTIGMG